MCGGLADTVINFKREVQKVLSDGQALENIELPERKRGRPLLLPEEIDQIKYMLIVVVTGFLGTT